MNEALAFVMSFTGRSGLSCALTMSAKPLTIVAEAPPFPPFPPASPSAGAGFHERSCIASRWSCASSRRSASRSALASATRARSDASRGFTNSPGAATMLATSVCLLSATCALSTSRSERAASSSAVIDDT
eukprot:6205743-Pleurochrysis_carterae.AAC.3